MALIQQRIKTIYGLEEILEEINSKIGDSQRLFFQQELAPTVDEGATQGDLWYDMVNDIVNIYREYPSGTGVLIWDPLLYSTNDTVDGGSW